MKPGEWACPVRSKSGWREHPVLAKEAIDAGARAVVFDEKNFETEEYIEEALKVKAVCDERKVPLYILNDAKASFIINVPLIVAAENGEAGKLALAKGADAVILNNEIVKGL